MSIVIILTLSAKFRGNSPQNHWSQWISVISSLALEPFTSDYLPAIRQRRSTITVWVVELNCRASQGLPVPGNHDKEKSDG